MVCRTRAAQVHVRFGNSPRPAVVWTQKKKSDWSGSQAARYFSNMLVSADTDVWMSRLHVPVAKREQVGEVADRRGGEVDPVDAGPEVDDDIALVLGKRCCQATALSAADT